MATAMKVCRVCGKSYEACRSANRSAGVFRWQEVACSPECGEMYLELIRESRRKPVDPIVEVEPVAVIPQSVIEPVVDMALEPDDELDEEEVEEDESATEPDDETPVEEE